MKIENIVKCKLDEIREVKHNEYSTVTSFILINLNTTQSISPLFFFNFVILFGFQKMLLLICDYYCRWSALFAILNIFLC